MVVFKKNIFLLLLLFFLLSNYSLFSQEDLFTIKGNLIEKGTDLNISNYPINIYPNLNDTTIKYTVYSSDVGFFFLTLPYSIITTDSILLKINNFENSILDQLIDTIDVSNNLYINNYYINSSRLKKIIVEGNVRSNNNFLADYFVFICDINSETNCSVVQTNENGFFTDTFYMNSIDSAELMISVFSYCNGNEELISRNYRPKNGLLSSDFNVCPNNSNAWQVSFFIKQISGSKNIYFSIHSNYDVDSVKWDFNDDSFGKGNIVIHNFSNEGSYKITMTAYRNGKSKKYTKRIFVGDVCSISGYVYASENLLNKGIVCAYQKTKNTYVLSDFAKIINGKYEFETLFHGNYLLYAVPEINIDTTYFPKYLATYKGGNCSWRRAEAFSTESVKSKMDIHLNKYSKIYFGSNSINFSVGNLLLEKYELVTVLLFNSEGENINSISLIDENSGSFNDLPEGKYTIQTEIAGVESAKYTFDLSLNENPSISFYSSQSGTVDYVLSDIEDYNLSGIDIYPNPFSSYFIVSTGIDNATLTLFDLSGKIVFKKKISNVTHIKTVGIENGTYLAVISLNNTILYKQMLIRL